MPANTTYGYPYPVGTDRVADGDDAIRALAEKIDPRVREGTAGGVVTIPVTAANTAFSVSVTFPVGQFSAAPWVVASNASGASLQLMPPSCTAITASGCTITGARNLGSAAYFVQWHAIGS